MTAENDIFMGNFFVVIQLCKCLKPTVLIMECLKGPVKMYCRSTLG